MKLGIIGTGSAARNYIHSFAKLDSADITSICDPDPEALAGKAAEFGIPRTYDNYRDLTRDTSLQGVIICDMSGSEKEIILDALSNHKHVLTPPPLTANSGQLEQMTHSAERSGRMLCIESALRFEPRSQYLKKALLSKKLGEIFSINADYQPPVCNKYSMYSLLDLILWLIGFPDPGKTIFTSNTFAYPKSGELAIHYQFFSTFEKRLSVYAQTVSEVNQPVPPLELQMQITGSKGRASYSPFLIKAEYLDQPVEIKPFFTNNDSGCFLQAKNFMDSIATGKNCFGKFHEIKKVIELIQQVDCSHNGE